MTVNNNNILVNIKNSDIPSDGVFIIPSKITIISSFCFNNCNELKQVIFHDNIEEIGGFAFYKCSGLKSIELPKNIKVINVATFLNCISLKRVVLPEGLLTIRDSAFLNCESLKEINFPNSLQFIGYAAFKYCSALQKVDISSTIVEEICNDTFAFCSSIKYIKLPNSLTCISRHICYECSSLEKINIPVFTKVYCNFYNCRSLKSVNGLRAKYIDDSVFIILSEKILDDYTIYKGYYISNINEKDKQYFFVASKDNFFSHGETIEKAIEDLNYKILQEKLAKEPIYMDTLMSIERYRAITCSCRLGVKNWMQENNISEDDKLTVKELLPIIEKTNAYGLSRFKEAIKDL